VTERSSLRPPSGGDPAPKPRWRVWSVRVLVGGFIAALLLWSALNLSHGEPPAALWSSDDLPSVPAPEVNGWSDLYQHPELFRGLDTGEVDQVVRAVLETELGVPPPASAALEPARRALERADIKQAWEICEASLGRSEFVDACPLDFSGVCPGLDVLECQRLGSFHVIEAAARGEWSQAAGRADVLMAQRLGHVRSARSPLGMMIALRAAREGMDLSSRLVSWARAAQAEPALGALQRRVRAFVAQEVDLTPALVGEYLLARTGAERIASGEVDSGGGALPRFFFDPGATVAELNRIYRPARLTAQSSALPDLPAEPYTAHFGWWIRNPLGKLYLDTVLPPRRVFEDLVAERAALIEQRAVLGALLDAH
jgi:hypothetical protein